MLDITLLRKDLDSVVARLLTRKNPQAYLSVDAFKALEAERTAHQTTREQLDAAKNAVKHTMPASANVMRPSTRSSANEDTMPVMCEV